MKLKLGSKMKFIPLNEKNRDMQVFLVLDATGYPIECFRTKEDAEEYKSSFELERWYIIRMEVRQKMETSQSGKAQSVGR